MIFRRFMINITLDLGIGNLMMADDEINRF